MIESYLSQLSEKEKIALEIAKRILGSSFDVSRSIGYLKFKSISTFRN